MALGLREPDRGLESLVRAARPVQSILCRPGLDDGRMLHWEFAPADGLQEDIEDRKLISWDSDRTTLRKTMAMTTRNPRMTRRRKRKRSQRPRIPKRSSKRVSYSPRHFIQSQLDLLWVQLAYNWRTIYRPRESWRGYVKDRSLATCYGTGC